MPGNRVRDAEPTKGLSNPSGHGISHQRRDAVHVKKYYSKFAWRWWLTSDLLIRSCIAALQSLTFHTHCVWPQTTHREHDAPCQMGSLVGTDHRSRGVWTRLRGYGYGGAGDAVLQHDAVHTHHSRNHHGSQDCCSTTPQMRAALGQPSSLQGTTFSPVALRVVLAFSDFQIVEFSSAIIAAHSHDPPASCSKLVLSLRI